MTIVQMLMSSVGSVAAPEFIGASCDCGGNEDTLYLSYPAGIESGDLMWIATTSRESGSQHPYVPSGWDELSGDQGFALLRKVATGSESGSLSVSIRDKESGAVLFVLRNASATPVDYDWEWSDGQEIPPVAPSSVATAPGQIHLIGFSGREPGGDFSDSTPAGYFAVAPIRTDDGGLAAGYYGVTTAAGATGGKAMGNDSDQPFCAWSVIIGAA